MKHPLVGRTFPGEALVALHRRLDAKNSTTLNRAGAQGAAHFDQLGTEHVYRDPDTGRDVPASEAPSRAFTDSVGSGRASREGRPAAVRPLRPLDWRAARRSRVQAARDTGNVVPLLPARTVRPRERREREHVARSTSSGDSGEGSDHEEPEPLAGLTRPAGVAS